MVATFHFILFSFEKSKCSWLKMVVWEDAELAPPQKQGACQRLVGDSDAQGDGRNPKVNRRPTPLAGSWFTSMGLGQTPAVGAPRLNYWTNREPQTPGNIHRSEVSWRSSSQHQDPALPNSLQTPVLEASGQTTSKTGTQSHSLKKKKKWDGKKICHRWRSKVKTYKTK